MKKFVAIILIAAAVAAAFIIGRSEGIRHAMENCELWTVDVYDPQNPEASAWNGYDQKVYIDLDDRVYERGMTQY